MRAEETAESRALAGGTLRAVVVPASSVFPCARTRRRGYVVYAWRIERQEESNNNIRGRREDGGHNY